VEDNTSSNSTVNVTEESKREKREVNVRDNQNRTDLINSILNNESIEVIEEKIYKGADVNAKDNDGKTPLMYAAYHNKNADIIKMLIAKGAKVNELDVNNQTALDWASQNNDNPDVFKVLLANGSKVNTKDNEGITPLMKAARDIESLDIINLLLEKGADVNAKDNDGCTPLMFAAYQNRNIDIIKTLINKGAKVNYQDYFGRSSLMWAAQHNSNPGVIMALLEEGADITLEDNSGNRAVDYARFNYHIKGTTAYDKLRGIKSGKLLEYNIQKATYNQILLEPDKYLNKYVEMTGQFYIKDPERESFFIKNGSNEVEIFYYNLSAKMQALILTQPNSSGNKVIVEGSVFRYSDDYNSYYLIAKNLKIEGAKQVEVDLNSKEITYVDILVATDKYLNKDIKISGEFYQKDVERESFYIKQGDYEIEIFYSNLPSVRKDLILKEDEYSDRKFSIKGTLYRYNDRKNTYYLVAKDVSIE
jgi:ankyrin repeat protein